MKINEIISDLLFELDDLGYSQQFDLKENAIYFSGKGLVLKPKDLFFVDAAFIIENEIVIFVINSPLYNIKGYLKLTVLELENLKLNGYEEHFDVALLPFDENSGGVVIKRQYNMRKISRSEYDSDRFEWREGFPDFPPCPYGHCFKALGYDKQNKEYVRFASSILKKEDIKPINYNSK